MISEPTPPRSRSPVALLWPVACLLAVARVRAGPWPVPEQVPPPPAPGPASPPPVAAEPLPPGASGPIGPVAFPDTPAKLPPGDVPGTVGCATCGGIGQVPVREGGPGFQTCSSCRGAGCVPGRKPCYPYEGNTLFGRFCAEIYSSICCPDPCYEPGWVAAANAAFFVDYARPRTVMRFRNDYGWDLQFPDRNEFFWAREQIQKNTPPSKTGTFTSIPGGVGPGRPSTFPKTKPFLGQPSLRYDQLTFYSETATSTRASLFVELAYRTVTPKLGGYHAGFADMNIGTKGVLLDTELLLLTMQFRTYLPTGQSGSGLGTGHISLEPSLLASLKLSPNAYFQGQLSEWIPIGGDNNYQGAIIHYHGSYNQVLFRFAPDSPLIATFEGVGYTFQDGAYTNPAIGPYVKSSGTTYYNLGAGLRAVISNAVDFGVGVLAPVTPNHWGDPTLRVEFRILY